jgi:hypothetical protein
MGASTALQGGCYDITAWQSGCFAKLNVESGPGGTPNYHMFWGSDAETGRTAATSCYFVGCRTNFADHPTVKFGVTPSTPLHIHLHLHHPKQHKCI